MTVIAEPRAHADELCGFSLVVRGRGGRVSDAHALAAALLASADMQSLHAEGRLVQAGARDGHAVLSCFAPASDAARVTRVMTRLAAGSTDLAGPASAADPIDAAIERHFCAAPPKREPFAALVVAHEDSTRVTAPLPRVTPVPVTRSRHAVIRAAAGAVAHVIVDLGEPRGLHEALAGSVVLAAITGDRSSLVTRCVHDALGGGYDIRGRLRLVGGREWLDIAVGLVAEGDADRAVGAVRAALNSLPHDLVRAPELVRAARARARSAYLFAAATLAGRLDSATSLALRGFACADLAAIPPLISALAEGLLTEHARSIQRADTRVLIESVSPQHADPGGA